MAEGCERLPRPALGLAEWQKLVSCGQLPSGVYLVMFGIKVTVGGMYRSKLL